MWQLDNPRFFVLSCLDKGRMQKVTTSDEQTASPGRSPAPSPRRGPSPCPGPPPRPEPRPPRRLAASGRAGTPTRRGERQGLGCGAEQPSLCRGPVPRRRRGVTSSLSLPRVQASKSSCCSMHRGNGGDSEDASQGHRALTRGRGRRRQAGAQDHDPLRSPVGGSAAESVVRVGTCDHRAVCTPRVREGACSSRSGHSSPPATCGILFPLGVPRGVGNAGSLKDGAG